MPRIAILLFFVSSLLVCTASYANQLRTQFRTIDAPSLEASILDTTTEQSLYVYLPPSYFSSDKRYPVVYYLHGFQGGPFEALAIAGNRLDKYTTDNQIKEMIIVGVNGANQFGGSFYTNSPVTGNWEDFVTSDVLNYVDNNFRTLASADNRGIVGFSMGGFAAINIAFRHPDKFKHIFSLSPGLFDTNGLEKAVNQWMKQDWAPILDGYAAAFAPNPEGVGDRFWYDWDPTNKSVVQMWESGFGNVAEKVDAYIQKKERLSSIYVEYGSDDTYQWIPEGSKHLVNTLRAKGIDVEVHDHGSGHVLTYLQGEHIIHFFGNAF